ncbi:hypothetical protein CDD80_4453 [Ophiocordyceps camponoti-rufipedis]|uniref:BTB domain-containing protein n=1 Tax=Ophiocordyceps camponoti-rufipedis TaxID=2004952 RepID=A0A2C5ZI79_9HYPO|nr:hypothetical protein CDD80_4453 [Ophiocordyceps camponoti-rufipedis]
MHNGHLGPLPTLPSSASLVKSHGEKSRSVQGGAVSLTAARSAVVCLGTDRASSTVEVPVSPLLANSVLPVMPRTPLDGRGRKSAETDTPRAKKAYHAHLKEAEPPKTNPWRPIKAPSAPLDDEPPATDQVTAVSRLNGPSVRKDAPETIPNHRGHQRSVSHGSPSSSRDVSQPVMPCVGESLWNLPVGADILLYAEDKVLHLHRSVVAPKSGWLRDKLLPPHATGAPVGVFFSGPAKVVGHSLKFMYTGRLEPCEPKPETAGDISYIVCCALFYLAAVDLQAPCIASHILGILACAADKWKGRVGEEMRDAMSGQDGLTFTLHLQDAIDAAYAYPRPEFVRPLRLALAGFVDAVLPLIFKNAGVIGLLSTPIWRKHSSAVAVDLVEHRRRQVADEAMATDQELQTLFEALSTVGYGSGTWLNRNKTHGPSSRRSQ